MLLYSLNFEVTMFTQLLLKSLRVLTPCSGVLLAGTSGPQCAKLKGRTGYGILNTPTTGKALLAGLLVELVA